HYSHLKNHASLKKHLRNVSKKKNQIQIKQCLKTDQASFKKKVYHAELNLTMFCIQHNLSFLLMDFLPQLLSECCPDSKIAAALKCGRTKSKMLTDVLGAKAKENIVSVLQTTKFSCIIDETTDVSSKKSLVIVVRYYDKLAHKVRDRFLSLIEVSKTDADSLYNYINDFFSATNIPLKNVIGLATDGANVMAGELGGLKAKFMKDGDIFYIKCSCHSLHLCSAYACKKLPIEIDKLCRSIYTFFAHSAKRIYDFKEFQEYCQVEPHKILGVSTTRWLALEGVINRIIEQWDALQLYFISNVIEVNGINAAKLAKKMGNPSLRVYFLFLSYVLKIINDLNKDFQSEKIRLPYLYSRVNMTIKLTLSNFMKNSVVKNLDVNAILTDFEKLNNYNDEKITFENISKAQQDMF
ncbi:zinc finger MYM-type protein 6-like, partial [Rhagoletis pomonella]|uniref:zinc finger MYM-type protein 6-like n=1 Tax=Rhagoletis pomonella TaxID=28610 RepID=UPI001782063A